MQNSPTTSTSKFKLATLTLLPVFLAIGACVFTLTKAPDIVHTQTQGAVQILGFTHAKLPPPSNSHWGQLTYNDLKLDTDGFSTIKTLNIHYDPLSTWYTKRFNKIELTGLRLIGELEGNSSIRFAGHSHTQNEYLPAFNDLTIDDGQITLQSDTHGIITLSFEAQGEQTAQGLEARHTLNLAHNFLRLQGIGHTHLSDNWWTSSIEVQQANLDHSDIKMTRASGHINLQAQTGQPVEFETELRSDGLKFINQNWKNASLGFRGRPEDIEMLLGAKTISTPDIELSLNLPSISDKTSYSGTLFAPTYDALKSFLQNNQNPSIPNALLEQVAPQDPVNLSFEKSKNELISSLKDTVQYIDIKIEYSPDSSPSFGIIRPENFSLFAPKAPIRFTGEYSRITALNDENAAQEINIRDGRIEIGEIAFTIAQTSSLNAPCYAANLKIETQCMANLAADNNKPSFKSLQIDLAEGLLSLSKDDITDKHFKAQIQDIEIFELLSQLKLKDWEGHGKLNGHFIIQNFQDTPIFTYAQLNHKQNGVFKINDPDFLSLIKTDEEEFELIKLALQDFHYESLKIDITRIGKNELEIKINATGQNPSLMRGRKFSMSFDFKIPASLFSNALWTDTDIRFENGSL